jgi:hypothetical protein
MRSAEHAAQMDLSLSSSLSTADDMFVRFRALGLKKLSSCRLTRNRTTMVSFGRDELRIHSGFLQAPDDILRAIVRFVEASTSTERRSAKRLLLGFPIDLETGKQRNAVEHPDDAKLAARLMDAHGALNTSHFGGALAPLCVRVSRRMRARLGHYTAASNAGNPAEIAISLRHLRREGWEEALRTLLHEMVHQWQDENGHVVEHGRLFRAKAREVGIPASARRVVAA